MSWLSVALKNLVPAIDLVGKLAEAASLDPNRSQENRAHYASLSQLLELVESALRLGENSSKKEASETGNDHTNRFTIDG